jgi:oligopeptide transport system permease protein
LSASDKVRPPWQRFMLSGWGVAVALAAAGPVVLIARALGLFETLALVVGLLATAATSWLSARALRVLGPVVLGAVLFAASRPALGVPVASGVAGLGFILGYRFVSAQVLRRITFMLPSLLLLIFVTTLLMYNAPGNPFAQERVASAQVEEALRLQYGVPDSAVEFFGVYLRRLIVDGDFGPSIKVRGRSVLDLLAPAFPVSMALGLLALILAVLIGLSLGIRAGLKPNSVADHSSMLLALVGLSLPNFVIGAALMILLALQLGWLPVAGWGGYKHLVMPALTLALPYAAYVARLARGGTIEVMQQDFIRTARAKGLPGHAVILKHALKGAILPVVSFLGPAAAGILTGSFVVETLFGIPGMGQWFVKGAINRDYSVVLGTAIIYTSLVTSFNLLVDLAYAWLDPRVRKQL